MKLSVQYRGAVTRVLWSAKNDLSTYAALESVSMLIMVAIDSFHMTSGCWYDEDVLDQDILILKRIRSFIETK